MSHSCHICGKYFSKPFNLHRHKRKVHDQKPTDNIRMATNGSAVLQHPFTCIVAGCTQSGKTVWVKSLLENAQKTISPPPQRIIWCYGQWQPSYFDMMRTMPGIEFNQDYLDISQRNLIVLDDLMAQGKDKRIADLFTKGSHHRNLSIIYIVQNVFHQGKEMRNIVLFKSPRDKQQISMLARQVNPGKVQELMRSYEDATRRPHGYLMLDLKPTTDDQQRLKTNVLPGEIAKFLQKQSYRQPPLVNAMYDAEQRMKEIMEAPQLSAVEKSKLYSDQLNRFLTFKIRWLILLLEFLKPLLKVSHKRLQRYHHKCLLCLYQRKYHHQCLLLLNLISLHHPQQKRNGQNSSATFSTIGSTQQIGPNVT